MWSEIECAGPSNGLRAAVRLRGNIECCWHAQGQQWSGLLVGMDGVTGEVFTQPTWKNSADISKKGASKSSSYTDRPSKPRIMSI